MSSILPNTRAGRFSTLRRGRTIAGMYTLKSPSKGFHSLTRNIEMHDMQCEVLGNARRILMHSVPLAIWRQTRKSGMPSSLKPIIWLMLAFCGASCTPPVNDIPCVSDEDCPRDFACNVSERRCYYAASQCSPGYEWNGLSCVDVDECYANIADCLAMASCINTSGGFECICPIGSTGDGRTSCATACSPSNDTDTGTATYTVTHMGLPSAVTGFDIDGLDNSTAAGGRTIAGCGVVDAAGGIDNGLLGIATALSSIFDIGADLSSSLLQTVPDAGTQGFQTITISLDHLSNGAASDACIGVNLRITVPGTSDVVYGGSGYMADHVVNANIPGMIELFGLMHNFDSSSCIGGQCVAAPPWALSVRNTTLRLALSSDNSVMLPGSLLGGFAFFYDSGSGYITGSPSVSSTGLRDRFSAYSTSRNLDPNLVSTALTAFQSASDIHMDPDGSLTPCTSPTNSVNNTTRNSISLAMTLDSL